MSNAPSTLAELVAPLSESGFLQLLQARKLTLLREANGHPYTEFLSWNALQHLIERGEYPQDQDHFRVAKESVPLMQDLWTSEGKADIAKLESYMAQGNSVIITHIEPFIPALAALCASIKFLLKEQVYAGVIATSGKDGAFKLHYDFEDLIIVQTEGTKRWQIYGPPVSNPIRGIPKQSPPETAPIFDEILEPGDILFVPAGNWHHCEAGPGRSVHLGIFILPPAGWHGIRKLLSPLIAEEIFRMPLTRIAGGPELAALEADAKNRLIEKIGQLNLSDLIAEWGK